MSAAPRFEKFTEHQFERFIGEQLPMGGAHGITFRPHQLIVRLQTTAVLRTHLLRIRVHLLVRFQILKQMSKVLLFLMLKYYVSLLNSLLMFSRL